MKAAPKKNQRVTLLRLSVGDFNDYGEPLEGAWESLGDRWAAVATKATLKEFWNGTENVTEATHLIQLVNDSLTSTLTVKDQIEFDGAQLRVLMAFDPNRRGRELHVLCRETLGDVTTGDE